MIFSPVRLLLVIAATPACERKSGSSKSEAKLPGATAPTPAIDMFGNMTFVQAKVEIDEKTLQEIADATGGRYFRATDNEKLHAIYDEINRLEKSKVEVADFTTYTEEYLRWVLAALALLAAEFLIRTLILKRIP